MELFTVQSPVPEVTSHPSRPVAVLSISLVYFLWPRAHNVDWNGGTTRNCAYTVHTVKLQRLDRFARTFNRKKKSTHPTVTGFFLLNSVSELEDNGQYPQWSYDGRISYSFLSYFPLGLRPFCQFFLLVRPSPPLGERCVAVYVSRHHI